MGSGSIDVYDLKIDLTSGIKEVLEKTGKDAAADIANNSPTGTTGRYKAGWTSQLINGGKTVAIYNNGKDATLTHLLEFGTAKRTTKSGKNTGVMSPREHIRPAYNRAKAKYLNDLNKIIIKPE